jgi:hypothetical protein
MKVLLGEWQNEAIFPVTTSVGSTECKSKNITPFPALHCRHSCLNIVMVTVDLLLEIFLPVVQDASEHRSC